MRPPITVLHFNYMKTKFMLVLASVLVSFGLASVVHATELARINSSVITLEDFNKKYRENLKFFQFKAPTKKGVLDDLIKRELGVQEAKRQGLDKDPLVIERVNTVLYHALIEKKLSKEFDKIQISDDEAKAFYAKNPEIRTSHIFFSAPADSKPELEKKARENILKAQEELKKGNRSFAEIAQRLSEGIAAPMGGDIDYQTRDKLDPAYYEAALALKTPGKVSDIVRTQFGFHIIKLTAIRPWTDVDKAQVKRLVFDERRSQIFENYMNQLRQQAKVSVNGNLLKD